MAEKDDEKSLDLGKQLVQSYKEANVELMNRVSIIKNSYSEAAKEYSLIKQVQQILAFLHLELTPELRIPQCGLVGLGVNSQANKSKSCPGLGLDPGPNPGPSPGPESYF